MRSQPFTIPRIIFARLTAELYVRRFWVVLIPWPLLAGGLIILSRDPRITVLALIVGLWPLTIPIRAYLLTSKTARLMERPTWVSTEGDWLFFHPEEGMGMKVNRSSISKVVELHGYLGLVVGYVKFAFIPLSAFKSEKEAEKFRTALSGSGSGSAEVGLQ